MDIIYKFRVESLMVLKNVTPVAQLVKTVQMENNVLNVARVMPFGKQVVKFVQK